MKKSVRTAGIGILAIMMATTGLHVQTAAAGDAGRGLLQQFAFAPSGYSSFSEPQMPGDHMSGEEEYEGHELNDAWLGMPVRARDGTAVGYVADALLDDEGYVSELIVELDGARINTVSVPGDLAELTDISVDLDLSRAEVADLVRRDNPYLTSSFERGNSVGGLY